MLFFPALSLLHLSAALPSVQPRSSDYLVLLDTGVGHRSTPIPRWPTTLRRIGTDRTNKANLTTFGVDPATDPYGQPIQGFGLAYSPSTSTLFSATGRGIIRTNLDGSNGQVIVTDSSSGSSSQIVSITVAEKAQRIYYGGQYTGLIYSANYDGSDATVFRNVSQGLDYFSDTYTPANTYPGGIAVDEERGWLYWSSTTDGSIRRIQLSGEGQEQILVTGIDKPTQIRVVVTSLFWIERGSWSSSPTAIKYLKPGIDQLPANSTSPNLAVTAGTLISSSMSPLFTETDWTGEKVTLNLQSFAVYRNGFEQFVYFAVNSAGRSSFGKVVETRWQGSGDGRGPVFKILSKNTSDVGLPVGLVHVL